MPGWYCLAQNTKIYNVTEKSCCCFQVIMTKLVISEKFWEDEGDSSLLTSVLTLLLVSDVLSYT